MTPERQIFKSVGGVDLGVDVFVPQGAPSGGAICLFFGGGWRGGSPTQFHPYAAKLARRGLWAFCAEYRVLGDPARQAASPFDCVADGKSAVRWIRAHAADWGLDPGRIAAGGGSAGGHVAAAAGLIPGLDAPGEDLAVSSVPDALVLYNPVVDTTQSGWAGGVKLLGDRARQLSPVHHVAPGAPPTILFHGTADTTVPYENAERFAEALRTAGSDAELVGYPEQGHGFFNHGRGDGSGYTDTLARTVTFLDQRGFLGVAWDAS